LAAHEVEEGQMSHKAINVSVSSRETSGNVEKMIRRFLKKTKKAKIVEQVRDRKHYKKPSVKKKEKRQRAIKAALREQQKKRKAQERRNRNK
jgi:ribosomal protein S21